MSVSPLPYIYMDICIHIGNVHVHVYARCLVIVPSLIYHSNIVCIGDVWCHVTIIHVMLSISAESVAACVTGDIRLVGGANSSEGRVEVCLSGRWGKVSNRNPSVLDSHEKSCSLILHIACLLEDLCKL